MKRRRPASLWIPALAALALALTAAAARAAEGDLELRLDAGRATWRLGERIEVAVSLANVSGSDLELPPVDAVSGTLQLFVAADREKLREYEGPNWGIGDGGRDVTVPLRSGEESTVGVVLLWNQRTPSEHLSPLYAERIREETLDADVAIIEPGRYWLEAVYTAGKVRVVSEPVPIDVGEPDKFDVPIWERMQRDGELAYLVHTGALHFPAGSAEEEAWAEDVRRLTAANPDSPYAAEIDELLAADEKNPR